MKLEKDLRESIELLTCQRPNSFALTVKPPNERNNIPRLTELACAGSIANFAPDRALLIGLIRKIRVIRVPFPSSSLTPKSEWNTDWKDQTDFMDQNTRECR